MGSYASLSEPLLPDGGKNDVQCTDPIFSPTAEAEKKSNSGHAINMKSTYSSCEPDSEVLAEVTKTAQLAWPLILFNMVVLSVPVITLMFVGHLGELELSSASIATSFLMVTAITVMIGLASTLETLCGQAYGAKNYRMLGVYLQSSFIVCMGTGLLITALWMNVATIFTAMGQDPEIARLAERYLIYTIPSIFGSGILRPTAKFLQSQGVVMPVLICSFIVMVLHIPACYTIIYVLDFGFIGGALSNVFTYQFLTLLVVLYTWGSGRFTETFTGFTSEAFSVVKDYLKLAIPSTFMLCLEYWTAEILVLSAGLLPNPQLQLSLLSISLSTTNLASMIPNGLGGATGTRVANELGAYRPQAAKLAGKVAIGISVFSTCMVASGIILARDVWGKAFSGVDEVLESVRRTTPLIALAAFLDGFQGVLTGITRGCGRQGMGAYINLAAFYVFGIPSGLYLGFTLHMRAQGLWLGLIVGELVQCLLLTLLILKTNWDKMADEAVRRVGPKNTLPRYLENHQQTYRSRTVDWIRKLTAIESAITDLQPVKRHLCHGVQERWWIKDKRWRQDREK